MTEKPFPPLINPFWTDLPKNSTAEQQRYRDLLLLSDERFAEIVARVPESEVLHILALVTDFTGSKEKIRQAVAYNRITNRICNFCRDKRDTSKLLVCGRCHMTFYCGKICQYNDWNHNVAGLTKHCDWCCNALAETDNGPNQLAILQVGDPVKK